MSAIQDNTPANTREERGLTIAACTKLRKNGTGWLKRELVASAAFLGAVVTVVVCWSLAAIFLR